MVIDTCGFEPGVVRRSAQKLAGSVGLYTFISSISAYADLSQPGVDELAPAAELPAGAPDTFQMENYGPLKALCEQAAEDALPGRALNIRPGLIVGEYDLSDRFTYWPWRVAQGGEVLAPGNPAHGVQFIDVRDLGEWTIRMVENGQTGFYNVTGPTTPLPINDLLQSCKQVSSSDAQFTWVDDAFLLENKVEPWMDLPLWLPKSDPTTAGLDQVSIRKALQTGLTFRPLEDTLQSTLVYANRWPADHAWRAGMSREREAELLAKYHGEK